MYFKRTNPSESHTWAKAHVAASLRIQELHSTGEPNVNEQARSPPHSQPDFSAPVAAAGRRRRRGGFGSVVTIQIGLLHVLGKPSSVRQAVVDLPLLTQGGAKERRAKHTARERRGRDSLDRGQGGAEREQVFSGIVVTVLYQLCTHPSNGGAAGSRQPGTPTPAEHLSSRASYVVRTLTLRKDGTSSRRSSAGVCSAFSPSRYSETSNPIPPAPMTATRRPTSALPLSTST